ncbi:hypothetical protein M0Q28_02945 [Patescibacteria group bacterium]|jgi:hypothetical protein|nr:hypothetical protein [Patescibacteria group bacterium]
MTPQEHIQPSGQEPLADKIIDRIEQEGVVPKPRWQFSATNQFFWVIWALSLVFAAAAAAAMIFALANAGWEFRSVTHDGFFSYLVDVLPVFWIAAMLVFVLLAYENLKRTKLGYRYPVRLIVGVGVIGSLVGGAALFAGGLGENVEENVGRHIPMYRPAVEAQRRFWVNPSKGLLGGEITQADPEYATFTVRTFDGGMWVVNGDELGNRDRDYLSDKRIIRIVGVPAIAATNTAEPPVFHACMVFPWEVRGHAAFAPGAAPTFSVFSPSAGNQAVRIPFEQRSTLCKGVRPYDTLIRMRVDDGR